MEINWLGWWQLSLRRNVTTTCFLNRVTMRLKGFLLLLRNRRKPYTSKKLTLGDEAPKVCGPCWSNFDNQLPEVVTLSYDLCLVIIRPCFKYFNDTKMESLKHILAIFQSLCFPRKYLFGPQNDSEILVPKKLPKIITMIEIWKLKGNRFWRSNWNRWVTTNIHLDHLAPCKARL